MTLLPRPTKGGVNNKPWRETAKLFRAKEEYAFVAMNVTHTIRHGSPHNQAAAQSPGEGCGRRRHAQSLSVEPVISRSCLLHKGSVATSAPPSFLQTSPETLPA